MTLGQAADNGVPVIGGGGWDLPENIGGVGEVTGGGGGAEVEEFGAGGVELEKAGGNEVSLELFYVREGGAFL